MSNRCYFKHPDLSIGNIVKGRVRYFIIPMMGLLFCSVVNASSPFVIGEAFDAESQALVYTESHHWSANDEHQVIYREPNGDIFAEKSIVYGDQPAVPDIWQYNQRIDETFKTNKTADGLLEAHYSRAGNDASKSGLFTISDFMVVDAGFHPFVAKHWRALVAGDKLEIQYLLPTRMRAVTLDISRVKCVDKEATDVCLMITASNWFIALLAKPLQLVYELETQKLIEFRGKSNIAGKTGDYHRVKIVYRYAASAD